LVVEIHEEVEQLDGKIVGLELVAGERPPDAQLDREVRWLRLPEISAPARTAGEFRGSNQYRNP
jgi:hypothetical protein